MKPKPTVIDKGTGRFKVVLNPTMFKWAVKMFGKNKANKSYIEDKPVK